MASLSKKLLKKGVTLAESRKQNKVLMEGIVLAQDAAMQALNQVEHQEAVVKKLAAKLGLSEDEIKELMK